MSSNYSKNMDKLIAILGKESDNDVWSLIHDHQKIELEKLLHNQPATKETP